MKTDLRRWTAFGTGVGVEIGERDLDVTIARVRPGGVRVLGSAAVTDYAVRPAAEWGRELLSFLRRLRAQHVPATVLLPRKDVVVREVQLPGVPATELAAAIQLQADSLHPFPEDEAVYSYARLPGSDAVLVGITRRSTIDHYATLFAEAGLKIGILTFSSAAIFSARRVLERPEEPVVGFHTVGEETSVYGESPTRRVFSASFDTPADRAVALAVAELRLLPETAATELQNLLPRPRVFPPNHDPNSPEFAAHAVAYATAIHGAAPRAGLRINLLPPELQQNRSRLRYVPTIALAVLLLFLAGGLVLHARYEDQRYLDVLDGEVKRYGRQAMLAERMDRRIAEARARAWALDQFRSRTKADLDALAELTKLFDPPAWVSQLELTRTGVQVAGESESAADILERVDKSELFRGSEFTTGITRSGAGEVFRMRAAREGAPQ